MDYTNLFRACVKTIRLRSKKKDDKQAFRDNRNSTETVRKCPITTESKQILSSITVLRNLLLNNRKDYINVSHLMPETAALTDYDRDRLDADCELAIKNCSQLLRNMKNSLQLQTTEQEHQHIHRQAIVSLVESYLKAVCKIYSEQRAIRVKKNVDRKKMSRLETLVNQSTIRTKEDLLQFGIVRKLSMSPSTSRDVSPVPGMRAHAPPVAASVPDQSAAVRKRHKQKDPQSPDSPETDAKNTATNEMVKSKSSKATLSPKLTKKTEAVVKDANNASSIYHDWQEDDTAHGVNIYTPEVRKQLQKENEQLFMKMSSVVDEVKQIEGKVVEIAKLQEVFSEKVLQQVGDIDRIYSTNVHTTEDIYHANDQIREAMQTKAGMRVWILFFLIVMTFTLVFLDWYNP